MLGVILGMLVLLGLLVGLVGWGGGLWLIMLGMGVLGFGVLGFGVFGLGMMVGLCVLVGVFISSGSILILFGMILFEVVVWFGLCYVSVLNLL